MARALTTYRPRGTETRRRIDQLPRPCARSSVVGRRQLTAEPSRPFVPMKRQCPRLTFRLTDTITRATWLLGQPLSDAVPRRINRPFENRERRPSTADRGSVRSRQGWWPGVPGGGGSPELPAEPGWIPGVGLLPPPEQLPVGF